MIRLPSTDPAGRPREFDGQAVTAEWVRYPGQDRVELWAGGQLLFRTTVSGACAHYRALGAILSLPHHPD